MRGYYRTRTEIRPTVNWRRILEHTFKFDYTSSPVRSEQNKVQSTPSPSGLGQKVWNAVDIGIVSRFSGFPGGTSSTHTFIYQKIITSIFTWRLFANLVQVMFGWFLDNIKCTPPHTHFYLQVDNFISLSPYYVCDRSSLKPVKWGWFIHISGNEIN